MAKKTTTTKTTTKTNGAADRAKVKDARIAAVVAAKKDGLSFREIEEKLAKLLGREKGDPNKGFVAFRYFRMSTVGQKAAKANEKNGVTSGPNVATKKTAKRAAKKTAKATTTKRAAKVAKVATQTAPNGAQVILG